MKNIKTVFLRIVICLLAVAMLGAVACTKQPPEEPEDDRKVPGEDEGNTDMDKEKEKEEEKEKEKEPEPETPPEPPVTNLFDKTKATLGWINGYGATSEDPSFYTSEPIPVEAGDLVMIGGAVTTQGWHLVRLDANGKVIGDATLGALKITAMLEGELCILEYNVPAGVSAIRCVCDTRFIDRYLVTVNEPLDEEDYYLTLNLSKPEKQVTERVEDTVIDGLRVLFCGDSISYGHWDDPLNRRAWAGRIAEAYGILADNRSVSGYCLSTIRGNDRRIINQLESAIGETYDMVILEGGVNDAWGKEDGSAYALWGEISDSFDVEDYDIATFAGGLEELFYYTKEWYPDAEIGYIFSFYMPGATGIGHVTDMEPYYAVAEEICEKWDVRYLDLYHDDYVSNTLLKVTTSECLRDPIHPNAKGYDNLAPYIGKWMNTFFD